MFQKLDKLTPEGTVDTCHRFGRFGPAYQVTGISRALESGDTIMTIHIFESNEDMEYPFSSVLNDPTEE